MLLFPRLIFAICMYSGPAESVNMLLFWGYPVEDGDNFCVKNPVDFETCLELCLSKEDCVAVYGSDSACTLCDTYQIHAFTHSNSSSQKMFAVKIDQQTQCPVDVHTDQYPRTNGLDSYTVQYNESIWSIDYKQKCPGGTWRIFRRDMGPICLTIIPMTTANKTEAGLECEKLGSGIQLAGMNSVEEREYIIDTAQYLLGHTHNKGYYTVWLNGEMREECLAATRASDCVGVKAFTGIPYMNNYDAYRWTEYQPDFSTNAATGNRYRCLQLMIGQDQKAWEGLVTNVMCEFTCNGGDALCAMGYVCAGPALSSF